MIGVVLAGGIGSRLHPLTQVLNKQLLPMYDRPMIYYPLELLARSGVRDAILVTSSGEHARQFRSQMRNGRDVGLDSLEYLYEEPRAGTAAALYRCRDLVGPHRMMIVFGDNIVEYSLPDAVRSFVGGVKVFVKRVYPPHSFARASFKAGRVVSLEPPDAKSARLSYAVTGIYMADHTIFEYLRRVEPGQNGERHLLDAVTSYLHDHGLQSEKLHGYWLDAASSFDSLLRASAIVRRRGANKLYGGASHAHLQ